MNDPNFHGPNFGFVLELYEKYLQNPNAVDEDTRAYFSRWKPEGGSQSAAQNGKPKVALEKIVGAANLAQAIRAYGHLSAHLDPLGSAPPGDPWLELSFHGIEQADLSQLPAEVVGGPVAERAENAAQAITLLREIYSGSIGYDYDHLRLPEERTWLRDAAEYCWFRPPERPVDHQALLRRLTEVDAFEQFLHRIFPGKTRFSIEGLDMLVPMLDTVLQDAAEADICTMMIAMAHRGRLNVLAHILGKPYAQILAEFKDPNIGLPELDELGWTGDVKYHKGARSTVKGGQEIKIVVSMPPNPSHLEHVDPVLVGMARAAGSKVDQPGPPIFFPAACLPVMIHGDASFSGQGIVAETLNFSRLPGYTVAGTLHIVANNQLGYTTNPEEGRSTLYASDLAKGFEIPILHVNADDPVACLEAVRTAFAYRQRFQKDFLINLIGYRRYGHNEGDEPSFTQPLMYQKIGGHPSVRAIWGEQLAKEGEIEPGQHEKLFSEQMNKLQQALDMLQPERELLEPQLTPPPPGQARRVKTAVAVDKLRTLNEQLLKVPVDFTLHRKIERAMRRRIDIFSEPASPSIDWSTAEELALASILADGIAIRFTGEDAGRGTFSQRHAVFHDTSNGKQWIPLQNFSHAKASFEILNSPLSENAALGFEFGYNIQSPKRLVIWEAQYGDFINAGQAIVDEFITSARAKWEQTPSLVLLLPHGHEGQGPDHSGGRLERFLSLAAQTNLRIANCTTAAQYFHLLRRQALLLETDPLPLVVMTPKSLLRHPLVASTPTELADGHWQALLDDPRPEIKDHPETVRRLILCSGKVYVDLITHEDFQQAQQIAVARVEQLYPYPHQELKDFLARYPNREEVVWLQEEPKNMGAWVYYQPRLFHLIAGRCPLRYLGRIANSSPAEGSTAWHQVNQTAIIQQALALKETAFEKGGLIERE